jgi:2-polyprenyl-6-methoxyphenol hydroxylase-like FAD-dependent oxidoreductase
MKPRVEIVGAGIAGLITGLAFAQKGWSVQVHEQNDALLTRGEGIYIWKNGLRVLDALGVLPRVVAGTIGAARHERRSYDGRTISSSALSPEFSLRVVPRENLLAALHEAFVETGGQVEFNSRVAATESDGLLHFADGSTRRGDLVVGADGRNSTTRDSLGLLRRRRPANQFGYRALIRREPEEPKTDAAQTHREYWNGSRRLLYAPCTPGLACVQLTSLAGDRSGNAVPIDRDFWRGLFPGLSWMLDRIPDDGRGDWFEIVQLECWSSGKVAIVGDAACAQPPFLGHGVGCSMMSAFALAQTIDRADDVSDGLREWELRERPFTDWVQWVAYWYGQLAFLPDGARTAVLKATDASKWLQRRIFLAAVGRDVTAIRRYSPVPLPSEAVHPLIH